MRSLAVGDKQVEKISGDAIISVAERAEATLVIEPRGDIAIVLKAGKGSDVRCYLVCDSQAKVTLTNHISARAVVHTSCLWLSGAQARFHNNLEGNGAQAYDVHAFIGKKRSAFRLDSLLRHAAHGTRGDILVKGVVKESASAALGGMIKIEKNGAGAESFLAEHVMLLGPDASASANPELEIENNDVSSRHAASVSQIDDEKIFYLMSRGVDREDACGLIVEGFLESAIGRIEDEKWRGEMLERAREALA